MGEYVSYPGAMRILRKELASGPASANELSAITGIPIRTVQVLVGWVMVKAGEVRRCGKVERGDDTPKGRKYVMLYERTQRMDMQ